MEHRPLHSLFYHAQSHLFSLFIIISYISYIGIAVGVQLVSPESLDNLDYYVKMYVSLFLLFRFNPFQKIKFNELDRKIAFSAGIFLVTTTVINTVVQKYAGALIGLIDL